MGITVHNPPQSIYRPRKLSLWTYGDDPAGECKNRPEVIIRLSQNSGLYLINFREVREKTGIDLTRRYYSWRADVDAEDGYDTEIPTKTMLEGSLGPYEDFVYLRNDELRRYTPVAEVLDRPIGRTLNGKDNRYLEGFLEKYETQVVDPTGKTVTRNQKIPRTLAGIQLWVAIHLYKWAFPNFNVSAEIEFYEASSKSFTLIYEIPKQTLYRTSLRIMS